MLHPVYVVQYGGRVAQLCWLLYAFICCTLYMLYSMEAELHNSAGCCTPLYVVPCICCTVWRQSCNNSAGCCTPLYVVPCICCTVWRQSCNNSAGCCTPRICCTRYMLYSMEAELHNSAGCCTPLYVVPCICCTVWRQSCTTLLAAVRLYMLYLVYVVQYGGRVVTTLLAAVRLYMLYLVYVVQYGGRVV